MARRGGQNNAIGRTRDRFIIDVIIVLTIYSNDKFSKRTRIESLQTPHQCNTGPACNTRDY